MSKFISASSWVLDEAKFLTQSELDFIRNNMVSPIKNSKTISLNKFDIKEWFLIELGLNTGLRVMEIADLKIEDIDFYRFKPSIFVRQGKGNKARRILINDNFVTLLKWFINWKNSISEETLPESFLLPSSHLQDSRISTRALQLMFKRSMRKIGIKNSYSIHCLRHTYAVFLYKASNYNFRFVQKQLGHSSIKTTQFYIESMLTDCREALEKLYA